MSLNRTFPLIYAPPPPPPVSPPPAVIVGIGEFGEAIIQALRARQSLHTRFQVAFGDWFDRFVYDIHWPTGALTEGNAAEIRDAFLQDQQISNAAHALRKAFRDARQHANQPWTEFVLPRVIIVGATWEPSGSALLWPAAALTRLIIGDVVPYELLGLFISAGYRSDAALQAEEDAHTFATLREGDQLLVGKNAPAWHRQLARFMGRKDTDQIERVLYDHVFLIDALKQNNTTSRAADDPAELHSFVSTVLEALLFTPTYNLLDQSLLDDFPADEQQVYVGAGASALTVPLREIEQVLREQTVAHMIRDRLLAPLSPEQRQDIIAALADRTYEAAAIRELRADVLADTPDGQPNPLRRLLAQWADPGVAVDGERRDYRLRYQLGTIDQPPGGRRLGRRLRSLFGRDALAKVGSIADIIPDLGGLRVVGPDPFSSDRSLRYPDVMNRLDAERETIVQVLNQFDDTQNEDEAARLANLTYSRTYQEHLSKLLNGERGLIQTIAILERARERWGTAAKQMAALADQSDENPEIVRLRDIVDAGGGGIYVEEEWLKVPLRWKPRFSSLLLRGLALIAVLYQFYWTAIRNGDFPPPLQALGRFSFPAIMASSWWEWLLLGLLFGSMLLAIIFLYSVPTLALRIRLRFHRRSMAQLTRVELERRFIRFAADEAATMHDNLQALLSPALALRDDLAAVAVRFAQNLGDDQPFRDYLEYKVVEPSKVISHEQLLAIGRESAGQRGQILGSWLEPRPLSPVDLTSPDRVIDTLMTHVRPITTSLAMRPVSDYLREEEHGRWFQYLWQGAVPWLKSNNGHASNESPPTCNIMLLSEGEGAPFARAAAHESGACSVAPWPDPYRILLLRLLGGMASSRLARDLEWRQAFQHLPDDRRRGMALAPGISDMFPATLAGPPTDSGSASDEQESLGDLIFGLEDAIQALVDEGRATENEYTGVDLALQPLYAYREAHPILDKQELVGALKPLDEAWEQWSADLREAMAPAGRRLDEFLIAQGIEPVRPPVGESFDPNRHGMAVHTEASELPKDAIAGLLYRGYRDVSTDTWLREPAVIVSSGSSEGTA